MINKPTELAHELRLRIYYEDTDAAGVVYHANYLKFMERGRTEWLRDCGFGQRQLVEADNIIFVVARLELDFRKPARIDEEIVVKTMPQKLGAVSVRLYQSVENEIKEIVCVGFIKLGCIDARTFQPKRIPEQMRGKIRNAD